MSLHSLRFRLFRSADEDPPPQHASEISAGLSSVTQENDLDEFLSTAQLAETDFSAGKNCRNIAVSSYFH